MKLYNKLIELPTQSLIILKDIIEMILKERGSF